MNIASVAIFRIDDSRMRRDFEARGSRLSWLKCSESGEDGRRWYAPAMPWERSGFRREDQLYRAQEKHYIAIYVLNQIVSFFFQLSVDPEYEKSITSPCFHRLRESSREEDGRRKLCSTWANRCQFKDAKYFESKRVCQ